MGEMCRLAFAIACHPRTASPPAVDAPLLAGEVPKSSSRARASPRSKGSLRSARRRRGVASPDRVLRRCPEQGGACLQAARSAAFRDAQPRPNFDRRLQVTTAMSWRVVARRADAKSGRRRRCGKHHARRSCIVERFRWRNQPPRPQLVPPRQLWALRLMPAPQPSPSPLAHSPHSSRATRNGQGARRASAHATPWPRHRSMGRATCWWAAL